MKWYFFAYFSLLRFATQKKCTSLISINFFLGAWKNFTKYQFHGVRESIGAKNGPTESVSGYCTPLRRELVDERVREVVSEFGDIQVSR
jgi:hypothetical protein